MTALARRAGARLLALSALLLTPLTPAPATAGEPDLSARTPEAARVWRPPARTGETPPPHVRVVSTATTGDRWAGTWAVAAHASTAAVATCDDTFDTHQPVAPPASPVFAAVRVSFR
jgi:hypothetical protein